MNLQEKLAADLKESFKAKKQERVDLLRLLSSVLKNKTIEKRGKEGSEADLTDEEVLKALFTEAKKRKESIQAFTEGDRKELAEKEKKELVIIEEYLPQQMSKEEIEKVVSDVLARNPADNFGLAMKAVMRELQGKADAATISDIVKSKLQNPKSK